MTRKGTTKGTKLVGAEIDEDLLKQFKAFCVDRRDTFRAQLELAMRRHLASPPPLPDVPPLPPIETK